MYLLTLREVFSVDQKASWPCFKELVVYKSDLPLGGKGQELTIFYNTHGFKPQIIE